MTNSHRGVIVMAVILMVVSVLLSGCSGMQIQYPEKTENCVNWVIKNRLDGDVVYFGRYTPVENYTHVWLEREGVCYDNMNPVSGFRCDSKEYKSMFTLDLTDPDYVKTLLNNRPQEVKDADKRESV